MSSKSTREKNQRVHEKNVEAKLDKIIALLDELARPNRPFQYRGPGTTPSPYIQAGYQCSSCGGYYKGAHVCSTLQGGGAAVQS
jgi:hypothetical protein